MPFALDEIDRAVQMAGCLHMNRDHIGTGVGKGVYEAFGLVIMRWTSKGRRVFCAAMR